jgi:hypothetical protein
MSTGALWATGRKTATITNKHNKSSSGSNFSLLMCLSWTMIASWLFFLVFCWESGLIHTDEIIKDVEQEVELIENSLRGAHLPDFGKDSNLKNVPTIDITPEIQEEIIQGVNDIHVVFSTDCGAYQDWQSLVIFHSALAVGQIGPVTRIASGCDDNQKIYLTGLYKKLFPNYHIHFTPDFKVDKLTGKKYDFYNKPWGVKHFLANFKPTIRDGIVIAILDPDMIFVRPLTTKVKDRSDMLYSKRINKDEIWDYIGHGKPAGQTYGLGAPWTNDNHKKFKRGYICGEGSPCLQPNEQFGNQHYSVGPPYMVEKRDMIKLADAWCDMVPRVYEGYPYLLAEMYAYSMAAAHAELPHTQIENYMVSNTNAGGEGWAHVDVLDDTCAPPVDGIYQKGTNLPTVLHYCQNFRAGEIGFAKRQVPKNIFNCDQPLLVEPPSNLGKVDYHIKNGKKEPLKDYLVKRNSYALCVSHRSINAAVTYYKQNICGNNVTNYEKTHIVLPRG